MRTANPLLWLIALVAFADTSLDEYWPLLTSGPVFGVDAFIPLNLILIVA
jgi:hypothetical protein